jgi:hypothetical protein
MTMTSMLVKAIISAAALSLLASTLPADAAQKHQRKAHPARAAAVAANVKYRGTNLFPAGPIYNGRDYIGDDPDPFIRSQLYRDLGARYGGNN